MVPFSELWNWKLSIWWNCREYMDKSACLLMSFLLPLFFYKFLAIASSYPWASFPLSRDNNQPGSPVHASSVTHECSHLLESLLYRWQDRYTHLEGSTNLCLRCMSSQMPMDSIRSTEYIKLMQLYRATADLKNSRCVRAQYAVMDSRWLQSATPLNAALPPFIQIQRDLLIQVSFKLYGFRPDCAVRWTL